MLANARRSKATERRCTILKDKGKLAKKKVSKMMPTDFGFTGKNKSLQNVKTKAKASLNKRQTEGPPSQAVGCCSWVVLKV